MRPSTPSQRPARRRESLSPRRARPVRPSGKKGPDDYEILGELGRGGMGVVYKARHRRLNRIVALKMIRGAARRRDPDRPVPDRGGGRRPLRHPNIVQIYDIGESDGSPFVALELLEGGSLAETARGNAPAAQAGGRVDGHAGAGHGRGSPGRHRASRPQAGQHPLHRRRRPQDHRLRPGQAAGGWTRDRRTPAR